MNNPNAMTGKGNMFNIRYNDGFYQHDMIGNIDAPTYMVLGSTIENIIEYPSTSSLADLNGRHIIANIGYRN